MLEMSHQRLLEMYFGYTNQSQNLFLEIVFWSMLYIYL
jgi:hypothetical protein